MMGLRKRRARIISMVAAASLAVLLAAVCLASLLILLTLAVTACGAGVSSLSVPVSNGHEAMWDTTTTTGSGPADLYCSVSFAASPPEGMVAVDLYNEAGELVDTRTGGPFNFQGLEPGKYRLAAFGLGTGYVSQWYGGLPMQGHDISESQVVELKPGRNDVAFVLQPGLSIQGKVSWTHGTPLGGYIQVYDLQHRDTGGWDSIGGEDPMRPGAGYAFLIVGLLPGRYRIGASFDADFGPPQVWDGGGSFEDVPVIDLTSRDIAGIHVKLGALPAATTTSSLQ
jgi:hypothetical protein